MRKIAFLILICAAAAWAAGPEAAAPVPPGAIPSPAPASAGEGYVPPSAVTGTPGRAEPGDTGSEVVLLSSGPNGCTFELKIPEPTAAEAEGGGRRFQRFAVSSFVPAGEAGAPELLVRHVRVAAPPEADVSVSVERVSTDVRTGVDLYPRPRLEAEKRHGEEWLREVFVYDAEAYRGGNYPAKFAELTGQEIVRGYRLLSVAVYPYQYQPATGTLRVAKSVTVRVSFTGGVRRPNARYPARPAENGIFKDVIPAVVLNWEAAAAWPFAGGITPATDNGVWPTDFADKAAAKVVIEEEALCRVGYADLKAAGFPVEAVVPANLRLYAGPAKRIPRDVKQEQSGLTEVPCYVAGQGDGRFDPGDYVEFYGHGCDFFEPVTPGPNGTQRFSKNRFTRYNVYWLVADDVPGKRFAAASVTPAGGGKSNYFWDRFRLEEDVYDEAETRAEFLEDDEYWYWRVYNAPVEPSPLTPFAVYDPAPGASDTYFQMMVREVEGYLGANGPYHTRVFLNYIDEEHKIFDGVYTADTETYFHKRIPSKLFLNGQNRIFFEEVGDRATERDYIMLDHFEFEYPRLYRAAGDYLHFSNRPDVLGDVLFEVDGFTTDDLVVYDVTRGRLLTGYEVEAAEGGYRLRFTDQIPSGQVWYVAASAGAAGRAPTDLYVDAGSTLREIDENVDLIVVTYDAFYDNVMPLVNLRRAEGLNVVVARVTDVYDEYSWGMYDPAATRSLVKDLYRKALYRPGGELPDHLLLVGDAWIDHRDNYHRFPGYKLWREFGRNQVPTYYVKTSTSGRSASDNFLVAMSDTRGPDLAVGRIAAPFDEMVDAVVEKIVDYKRHPVNGPWNGRLILCADNDDKVEPGQGGGGAFTYDNEELEKDFVPLGFEIQKQYIEWLNRRFPGDEKDPPFDEMDRGLRQYHVKTRMKPDFLKGFNGIIMHYAGHGGPQVWAHEDLLVHHKNVPPEDDIYKLENGPRFPVIIQCSCSTAYFDQWYWEEGYPRDYGQCISEYLLQQPRNATVAAMGSTRLGTEGGQKKFLEGFYGYVFPDKKVRGGPVSVGAAHFVGKVEAAEDAVRDMFTLLGDPSMNIAVPRPGVTLTPNKGTVKRGETFKVAGTVPGNFNGKVSISLFDRPFYFHSGDTREDVFRERLLYGAEVDAVNGRYEATLVVPTVPVNPVPPTGGDSAAPAAAASPAGGAAAAAAAETAAGPEVGAPSSVAARVEASMAPVAEDGTAYVKAVAYGTGFRETYICNESVTINVTGEVVSGDKAGPDVDVYLDDYSFRSGDPAGPDPTLLVDLRDESGVLVARNLEAIGKKEQQFVPLYATVDEADPTDLTYYYKPVRGDHRAGSVERKIALGDGTHRITVTAHDSLGNKNQRTVNCVVSGSLALFEVMNCPNPFPDETYFTFMSSTDIDSIVIKVYTATGRLVAKVESGGLPAGYHQIRWDGRDRDGDPIANGVYFYKLVARAGDEKIVAREKMVKLR
jgi:hypothetical protein